MNIGDISLYLAINSKVLQIHLHVKIPKEKNHHQVDNAVHSTV